MLVAYPSQGHEMLFNAHTRCFTALGGIPRRGIYDYVPRNIIVKQHSGHPDERLERRHMAPQESRLEFPPDRLRRPDFPPAPGETPGGCGESRVRNRTDRDRRSGR
ncbi:MAG: hypothetical protein FIA97_10610 [Methylococcaceae bacterium]|nr:hypothetical protein [Methylococcaceae bacterium]